MSATEIEMDGIQEIRLDSTITPIPAPMQRSWSMGSYTKLSEFMGSWSDVAIFRRFANLNAENLLFLQAELLHLEHELQNHRKEASKSTNEKTQLALRSWWYLKGDED